MSKSFSVFMLAFLIGVSFVQPNQASAQATKKSVGEKSASPVNDLLSLHITKVYTVEGVSNPSFGIKPREGDQIVVADIEGTTTQEMKILILPEDFNYKMGGEDLPGIALGLKDRDDRTAWVISGPLVGGSPSGATLRFSDKPKLFSVAFFVTKDINTFRVYWRKKIVGTAYLK